MIPSSQGRILIERRISRQAMSEKNGRELTVSAGSLSVLAVLRKGWDIWIFVSISSGN